MTVRLKVFDAVYGLEHESLVALGSSEVSVTSSPGSMTEATVLDKENEAARRRCARAVAHLRSASIHVELAMRSFGPDAEQPERSPDAVISESTFNRLTNRLEHERRERELRRK